MKYKFLVVIALIISVTLTAQENEVNIVIQSPIAYSQGFVLLRHSSDIKYWEIEILQRNYSQLTEFEESIVDRFTIIGDNYFKIPEEYAQGNNTYIRVKEILKNGEKNIEIDKVTIDPPEKPGISSYLNKEWKCNGSTYAWGIQQFVQTVDNKPVSSHFQLHPAVKSVSNTNPIIVTPYYQWFSPTQFTNFVENLYPNGIAGNLYINGVYYKEYYSIGNDLEKMNINNIFANFPMNSINLIKLPYNPLAIKKDKDGVGITGVNYVYGIAKALGPWAAPDCDPTQTCYNTNTTTYGPSAGVNTIQWAMNRINSDSKSNPGNCNKPQLTCSSAGGGIPNVGDIILDGNFGPFGPAAHIWDTLKVTGLSDFLSTLLKPRGDFRGNWWSDYHSISLNKISGNTSEIFSVKIEDVFSEEGFISNNTSTDRGRLVNDATMNIKGGLYSVLIQDIDGNFVTLYKEIKDSENNSVTEDADFLVKNIFPVPIVKNEFSISLMASKDLDFIYKLYDLNMNLLYETKVEIKEGESSTISINPNETIPSGVLFNQFIFEDGSQSSVTTVK